MHFKQLNSIFIIVILIKTVFYFKFNLIKKINQKTCSIKNLEDFQKIQKNKANTFGNPEYVRFKTTKINEKTLGILLDWYLLTSER